MVTQWGLSLFNVDFAQCRHIGKCHSHTITTFADTVHQCIKESKRRTPSLIILCEDASCLDMNTQRLKFAWQK